MPTVEVNRAKRPDVASWKRPAVVLLMSSLALAACSAKQTREASSSDLGNARVGISNNSTQTAAISGYASDIPRSTSALAIDTILSASSAESRPLCDPLDVMPVKVAAKNYYCELVQTTGGVTVLKKYDNASGFITSLAVDSPVLVSCLADGPAAAAPSAATNRHKPGIAEWYKTYEPVAGYAASNAFLNVTDPSIPFDQQPTSDPRVPACPIQK